MENMNQPVVISKDMNATENMSQPVVGEGITKLTPLDLNAIRLDVRHTILTPDYLENLQDS